MQIPPSSSTLKHSNIVSNALMHFPVFLVTLLNCISIFCVVLMPHDHHIVTEFFSYGLVFTKFAIGGYGEKGHLSVAHDRQAGQKRDASVRLLT